MIYVWNFACYTILKRNPFQGQLVSSIPQSWAKHPAGRFCTWASRDLWLPCPFDYHKLHLFSAASTHTHTIPPNFLESHVTSYWYILVLRPSPFHLTHARGKKGWPEQYSHTTTMRDRTIWRARGRGGTHHPCPPLTPASHLLCGRHWARCWKARDEQDKVATLGIFMLEKEML